MKNHADAIKDIKYVHRVQYYETDQMGIVHHSNYIRWFEEARIDFFEKIGYKYKTLEDEGIVSPVLSVECQYKNMTRFGEDVYIIPKITSFNGIKLSVSYQVIGVENEELKAVGQSSHCFLGPDSKPVSLKRSNPKLYEVLLRYLEIKKDD